MACFCPGCGHPIDASAASCSGCQRVPSKAGWPIDPLLEKTVAMRFYLIRILGEGGFGKVYEATHQTLGGRRAVKVLRQDLAYDDALVERFRREAQALYNLQAPQLVKVEDFGLLSDGRPFMVMELVAGMRLDALIRRDGPFSPLRCIRVTREVLLALAEAHEAGILHRDLKAENVMVKPDLSAGEQVKVLDLGVSLILGEAQRLTRASRTLGTPEYMSPEQWRGLDDLDDRADLFSMGILMYEMLVGDVPYTRTREGGPAGVYTRLMEGRPPLISSHRRDLPPSLEGFVLRMMATKREMRPDSAMEALEELERIREGVPHA